MDGRRREYACVVGSTRNTGDEEEELAVFGVVLSGSSTVDNTEQVLPVG